jgi:hypothetical protein
LELSADCSGVKLSFEAGRIVGLLNGPGVERVEGPWVARVPERENGIALTILV